MSADSELLIQLPYLKAQDSAQLNSQHIWYLEALTLLEVVEEVTQGRKIAWEDWWLLPESGRTNAEVVYTFIGSSKSLGEVWNPQQYGPTLSYSGGNIYTFNIAGDEPLYFARYHNLLVVGRFPFQLEAALQTMQGNSPSWREQPGFSKLLKMPAWQSEFTYEVIRKMPAETTLPPRWQPPTLPWSPTSGSWSRWGLAEQDSSLSLLTWQQALPKGLTGAGNAQQLSLTPAACQAALPLVVNENTPWAEQVQPWLGSGGWSLQLTGQRPNLWVLPVADSTAFAAFDSLVLQQQLLDQTNYQLFVLDQLQEAGPLAALSDRAHWQPWVCQLPEALIVGVFREDVERYLDYYLRSASLLTADGFPALLGKLPPNENATTLAYGQWEPLADGEDNLWTLLFPSASWTQEGRWLWRSALGEGDFWPGEAVLLQAPSTQYARLEWTVPLANETLRLLPVWDMTQSSDLQAVAVQSKNGQLWYFDVDGRLYWQQSTVATLLPPLFQQTYPGGLQHLLGISLQGWEAWDPNGDRMNTPKNGLETAPVNQFVTRLNTASMVAANRDSAYLLLPQGQALSQFPLQSLPDSLPIYPLASLVTPDAELLAQFRLGQGWWVYKNDGTFVDSFAVATNAIVGQPQTFRNTLIVATTDGYVHTCQADGTQRVGRLGRGPLDTYLPVSLWGDNQTDFIAQRGTLIHLFAADGDEKLQERWQFRLPVVPDRVIAASPLGVLAVNDQERKVWLIDGQGQLLPGFPLAGEDYALLSTASPDVYRLLTLLDGQLCAYSWPK
ncbi:MAG: hypothetical protein AAF840_01660 [Bacteroidota bacterium]